MIGRKAHTRRNNLFYDADGRIVMCAGSLITMLSSLAEDEEDYMDNTQPTIKQKFLQPDMETLFSTSPEISVFTLSSDQKYICAGTIELYAKLIVWEISSRTCINSITLPTCSLIQLIRFANDSKHVCCVVGNSRK